MGAVINVKEETPSSYKELWAIILDSGAVVSVCPQSFLPHVPMTPMTEEARRQYVTVTGRPQHQWLEGNSNGHWTDHLASEAHSGQCVFTTDWTTPHGLQ
eukprot:6491735-Amphidinium_carterae.1